MYIYRVIMGYIYTPLSHVIMKRKGVWLPYDNGMDKVEMKITIIIDIHNMNK